jgi:glycine cleavage system regulatory protein
MADTRALMADLIAVLDEHGVEYLSFTTTTSKKRMHGQIQFEEQLAGDKQERLPMAAGTTEEA